MRGSRARRRRAILDENRTWQKPGEIQQPKGTWQKPGEIQVPRGIQAIRAADERCAKRFTVGADALFAFDQATLSPEAEETLAALVPLLAKAGPHPVTIEGHTDERGSREYNIGLGERRAQAVRRALLLQGAADAQISTVSYGEERPAAAGHDETAWAKNRRVEIWWKP